MRNSDRVLNTRIYQRESIDEFLSRGGKITHVPASMSADQCTWESLAKRIDNAPMPMETESDASRWSVGSDITYAIRESQSATVSELFEN
jgi:hypothetical protein